MFLSYLKERNKEGFLKICVYAALSNDVFGNEEKEAIAAYCREMNVEVHEPEVSGGFEDLVKELYSSTTKEERNIIVLETLALLKADGVYDEKEQKFMKTLIDGFEVSAHKLTVMTELLDKYIQVGKELYSTITE